MHDLRRRTLVTAAVVAFADQVSKSAVVAVLGDGDWSSGLLRLTVVRNPGGPFGLGAGASMFWTVVTATVVIGAVAVIASGRTVLQPAIAVGAMVGGGIGNLVDRLARFPGAGGGAAIDWIRLEPYPRVFNVADVALRGGAVVVAIAVVARRHEGPGSAEVSPSPPTLG